MQVDSAKKLVFQDILNIKAIPGKTDPTIGQRAIFKIASGFAAGVFFVFDGVFLLLFLDILKISPAHGHSTEQSCKSQHFQTLPYSIATKHSFYPCLSLFHNDGANRICLCLGFC